MEQNNDSRNRYNDRNTRQSDQYSDWNQSPDFQQNRNQNSDRNENQRYGNSYDEDRDQKNYYGENRYGRNRNEHRLDSMGSLGNDTGRYGNFDNGQARNYDYGNRGSSSMYDNRNRNTGGSGYDNRYDNSRNWWDKTKDEVSGWMGDENAKQRRNMDQRDEHRGKGPKGYTRTDERIKEDVHELLTDDGLVDASEIEVDVKNGEIFLKGTVKSRQQKRRAEYIIEDISGVKNVENHIKVLNDGLTQGYSGQSYDQQYGEKKFGTNLGSGINAGRELNTHN